ncbi:hypothetical protein WJX79_009747 [Trebouxia sp. C0005]
MGSQIAYAESAGGSQRAADKKSTAPGHDVGGFLEYLDKSVYLTLTVTANPQLAFQSFANINYSGHPLGNEDILKAILVQRIPGKDEKVARQKHMREWKSVAKKLHSRQNLNSDSNATKAWHHRNGVMLKVASRGAIELPASLMDELFEHMRRLNDPDRLCQMDMLDFYRLQFQLRGDGRCLPELGFNVIPSLFVGEYLKPFGKALLTLLVKNLQQVDVILPPAEVYAQVFRGAGGYSRRWEGTLSVEHIMPQDPATDSDWFKEEGPGWTAALAKPWLHKLGNLCVLSTDGVGAKSGEQCMALKDTMMDKAVQEKQAKPRPQPKQKKRKPAGNLVLQAADKEKESFTLLPNQIYKVGRSEEFNDIVIPNDSVSGVHARIEPGAQGKGGKQINLFDEHSRNGTSVNGSMVKSGGKRPCVVTLGSVIKFGCQNAISQTSGGESEDAELEEEAEIQGESYTLVWTCLDEDTV